jgi:hypothetical protein
MRTRGPLQLEDGHVPAQVVGVHRPDQGPDVVGTHPPNHRQQLGDWGDYDNGLRVLNGSE